MSNCLFGWPVFSDVGVQYAPAFSGGSWLAGLPLTNLQDRRLALVARSSDAALSSTRFHLDLGAKRNVGVIALPKHTMSASGYARVLGQVTDLIFDYEAGFDIATMGGTFTRATTATYNDRQGIVRTAAAGELRDAHYLNGIRYTVLERASTNVMLQSQALDNAAYGSNGALGVNANVATAPDGTMTADRLNDAAGGTLQYRYQVVAVANDASAWTVSVYFKMETIAGSSALVLSFEGGVTPLLYGTRIRWDNATIADVTGVGIGQMGTGAFSAPSLSSLTALGNGWYRLTVTGANNGTGNVTMRGSFIPASNAGTGTALNAGGTGSVFCWGVQAENLAFPTSYIATVAATVPRNIDILSFTVPAAMATPVALTMDAKFLEMGAIIGGASAPLVRVSEAGTVNNSLAIADNGAGKYRSMFQDAVGTIVSTSAAGATPAFGDTVELRALLTTDATTQQGQSINGNAEIVAAVGAVFALPTTWGTGAAVSIWLGNRNGGAAAAFYIQSVRIMAGSANSLSTMQGAVYDSGWVASPLVTVSAEDASGVNLGWTVVPPSVQNARYWQLQIDDPQNAAGFVDVARLIIGGGYTPTNNIVYGAKLGIETETTRTVSDGGAAIYQPKPIRRNAIVTLENIADAEAFANAWKMQRLLGLSGQLYFVFDQADTTLMPERSFLCVMRQLSPMEIPDFGSWKAGYELVEEL